MSTVHHTKNQIHDGVVYGHESPDASKIPNETQSIGDPTSNNTSSSCIVGEKTESRQIVKKLPAEAAAKQLDRKDKAQKSARKSAHRIFRTILGFLNPIKPCNKGQRDINVSCISKVIKWFCNYFVNAWNLDELVQVSQSKPVNGNEDRLDRLKKILGDLKLTDKDGRPTSLLVDLMRDMVSQLVHLHKLGKTHGDLKPQNIVIIEGIRRLLCAKLSDIRKQLPDQNKTSMGHHSTGCSEEDMLSLGCIFFFCITGGKHPFGDDHDPCYLFLVEHLSEAHDVISRLLSPKPEVRPKAIEVLNHPLLWDSEKRLSFLCDTSDLARRVYPQLLNALQATELRNRVTKKKGKLATWNQTVDSDLIKHMLQYSTYEFGNVPDLLRFIRNLRTHYKEIPKNVKGRIGVKQRDLDGYFTRQFPNLFMEVYNVVCTHCKEEENFEEYFRASV